MRLRQQVDPAQNNAGGQRLADPADGQGAQRHAELNSRQEVLQIVLQAPHGACSRDLGGEELLDAGVAGADHGEFGGHKEGIGQNQHGDGDNLEKRQTVHPGCEDSIRPRGTTIPVRLLTNPELKAVTAIDLELTHAHGAYPVTAGRATETRMSSLACVTVPLELKLLLLAAEFPFFTGQLAIHLVFIFGERDAPVGAGRCSMASRKSKKDLDLDWLGCAAGDCGDRRRAARLVRIDQHRSQPDREGAAR